MRISVVTPSFNQAEWIEETLRSVANQGYSDIEHIVIDGGSTDGTLGILERFKPTLSYVQSQPDGGQTDALIQGFGRATGDVMAWLNSDDLYEPGTLVEVADHFRRHPEDRFIYGDATWVDRHGVVLRRQREVGFNRFIWLRTYNYIPQPSTFWRRDLYEEVGGLDPSFDLAMDSDLWIRFAERTVPRHIPRLWSRMRSYPEQKNVRLRAESDVEDERIRRRCGVPVGRIGQTERLVARAARIVIRTRTGAYWR